MKPKDWPPYMIEKKLKSGIGYYWNLQKRYADNPDCPVDREDLGTDYEEARKRGWQLYNAFVGWREGTLDADARLDPKWGTVAWVFKQYQSHRAFREKVSKRAQRDYIKSMGMIEDIPRKDGKGAVGGLPARSITPDAAQKIYDTIVEGGRGQRYRTANLTTDIARHAWRIVMALHPSVFDNAEHGIVNPWTTLVRTTKTTAKKAVDREDVYVFAQHVRDKHPKHVALGFAAIICFEWLQRPEAVIGGALTWNDIRPADHPHHVRIEHPKTGEIVWHWLDDEDGVQYFPEAEDYLSTVPRRGVPVILRSDGHPYKLSNAESWVRKFRRELGLPEHFTLDTCRHGGITEIDEADMTEGHGRALSAHKTSSAYRRYAKRTERKVLAATRKRRAWVNENRKGRVVRMNG